MLPALLFDLDGTLVDSIRLILESARHAFDGYAGPAPADAIWQAGIGRPLVDMFAAHALDPAHVDELVQRYRAYQAIHHDRLLTAYPGIVETVRAFQRAGHPMAIVTSKTVEMSRKALRHVGLDDAFPLVVGCDSCTRHKPDPLPVLVALDALRVRAQDAVFVGDSPFDVQAGRAAGVRTVGVTWGASTREQLAEARPDAVIDAVAELPAAVAPPRGALPVLQTF